MMQPIPFGILEYRITPCNRKVCITTNQQPSVVRFYTREQLQALLPIACTHEIKEIYQRALDSLQGKTS
jgi:hypothetical protein